MEITAGTLEIDTLLVKLYQESGYDFRDYKRSTISRRLARRLYLSGKATCQEYLHFLDTHHEEYEKLADYLTVKTSGFFRSPYAFQQLANLALPEIVSRKLRHGERQITFWSTACARGEEAYSIAIFLTEFLASRQIDLGATIYATDLSLESLAEARTGVYPLAAIEILSPAIRQRYFVHHGDSVEVTADIRQKVSFDRFDLTSRHPPFTGADAVFCCNVLIYLQKPLQERVLNMLCSSLVPGGYLVLGEVETPASSIREKLDCLDSRAKIYRKVTD